MFIHRPLETLSKLKTDLKVLQNEMMHLLEQRKFREMTLVERQIDQVHVELLNIKKEEY